MLKKMQQGWKTVGESFLTHLEDCRILDTSTFIKFGTILVLFLENWIYKYQVSKTDSDRSPSYNILEMTMGSFHGVGKKSTWSCYSRVKTRFVGVSVFLVSICKSLKS